MRKKILTYTVDWDWQQATIEISRLVRSGTYHTRRYKVWRNSPSANRIGRLIARKKPYHRQVASIGSGIPTKPLYAFPDIDLSRW